MRKRPQRWRREKDEMQDAEFQQTVVADAAKKFQRDHDDLQHEIAGQETGQQKRFVPIENTVTAQEEKRREERQRMMTALELIMMNDPEYAKLHSETIAVIANAEAASEKALMGAENRLEAAENKVSEMVQNASKLINGAAVFKDANGDVWTEDGQKVDNPILLDSIVWKDNATSYEEYREAQKDIEKERHAIDAIRRYQVDVLGGARDEMTDENNPLSKERMKKIQDDIITQSPALISDKLTVSNTANRLENANTFDVAGPKI